MKKKTNLLQKLGLALLLVSLSLLVGSEILAAVNRNRTQELTDQLLLRLPDRSQGNPLDYTDPLMPALELGGEDFCGLLEVPGFGITLPIADNWDNGYLFRFPCRFWGSAYDHSLIIGGRSQKGQFDFCAQMDLGNRVRVTDMTGTQFSYEITGIDRRKNADMDTFQEKDSDLILFTRDDTTGNYIIVRCQFVPGFQQ